MTKNIRPHKPFRPLRLFTTVKLPLQGGTYTVTAGTYSETVTLSELLYGSAAGMGSRGGFGGNMGGGRGHP